MAAYSDSPQNPLSDSNIPSSFTEKMLSTIKRVPSKGNCNFFTNPERIGSFGKENIEEGEISTVPSEHTIQFLSQPLL